jgi:predicted metal-binding membrane protein
VSIRFKSQGAAMALLMAAIVIAWSYLYYQARRMEILPMRAMWMPPSPASAWRLGDFAYVYGMWAVMMAAMMLPAALPMLNAYGKVSRRLNARPVQALALFAAAYLGLWILFSIAPTLLQWQLHGLLWLSPMMQNQNRGFAGCLFLLAGAYQFMPLKNACLIHCKTPMGFLLNEWQAGRAGAMKMGLKHGAHCIGCCWAQMLLMFAVGIMNLAGMALLTLIVCAEKWVPLEAKPIAHILGAAFVIWGVVLFLR